MFGFGSGLGFGLYQDPLETRVTVGKEETM